MSVFTRRFIELLVRILPEPTHEERAADDDRTLEDRLLSEGLVVDGEAPAEDAAAGDDDRRFASDIYTIF